MVVHMKSDRDSCVKNQKAWESSNPAYFLTTGCDWPVVLSLNSQIVGFRVSQTAGRRPLFEHRRARDRRCFRRSSPVSPLKSRTWQNLCLLSKEEYNIPALGYITHKRGQWAENRAGHDTHFQTIKVSSFLKEINGARSPPLHCLWLLAGHEMAKYQQHSSCLSSSFASFSFTTFSKVDWSTQLYLCPRLENNNSVSQKSFLVKTGTVN